ncbi:hypothetical protein SLS62_009070 [Diatrype stigma]|uniref:N-acetyltransferase domain-containing protein n=1 Tax=Diatrype stigma TaxID=117547 RepID=A0AAN9UIH5_9PEZI
MDTLSALSEALPDTITVSDASIADIDEMAALGSAALLTQLEETTEFQRSWLDGFDLQDAVARDLALTLSHANEVVKVARNSRGELLGFFLLSMGKPCPYLYIQEDTTGWACLETLCFDPGHRDETLGSRLVQAMTEVCKDQGVETVWVMECESDQAAFELYTRKCGFLHKGGRRFARRVNYVESSLVFVKHLRHQATDGET